MSVLAMEIMVHKQFAGFPTWYLWLLPNFLLFLFPLHFIPVGGPIWVMVPNFRITVLNVWILFFFLIIIIISLVSAHLSKLQLFEKQIE